MNRKINLPVCSECDAIQANRIYEVWTDSGSKVFDDPLLHLIISEFSLTEHKDDIIKNYNTLNTTLIFQRFDLASRYCATIYYTLQDKNIPVHIRKYCRFAGADTNKTLKLSKKISKYFGNVGVFILSDLNEYYKLAGIKKEHIQDLLNNCEELTLTRGIVAAIFYEGSKMTQRQTCDLFGISLPRLKRNLNKVRI
jgi:hypothetical protein